MDGGRIDCYLDVVSLFSYVAFVDLLQNLDALAANGVQVEFHPVLIGAINMASGNKPPWMLKAKAVYLSHDAPRALRRVGVLDMQGPEDLMAMANSASALRALHYIKANYDLHTFLATFGDLFHRFWTAPNANLSDEAVLRMALLEATDKHAGGSGRRLFGEADVTKIMDGRASYKAAMKQSTDKAIELGAFGAPWFWVTNRDGKSAPFFGSDRFNHIYSHLGIAFQDVKALKPSKL